METRNFDPLPVFLVSGYLFYPSTQRETDELVKFMTEGWDDSIDIQTKYNCCAEALYEQSMEYFADVNIEPLLRNMESDNFITVWFDSVRPSIVPFIEIAQIEQQESLAILPEFIFDYPAEERYVTE